MILQPAVLISSWRQNWNLHFHQQHQTRNILNGLGQSQEAIVLARHSILLDSTSFVCVCYTLIPKIASVQLHLLSLQLYIIFTNTIPFSVATCDSHYLYNMRLAENLLAPRFGVTFSANLAEIGAHAKLPQGQLLFLASPQKRPKVPTQALFSDSS